jgi:protein TonB
LLLLVGLFVHPSGLGFAQESQSGSERVPQKPVRVRISEMVSVSLIARKVQPVYPDEARRNGVQGKVVMRAEINSSGDVTELAVISGDPLLVSAALEAVRQWKYKPYLLNGQPVDVETQVTVAFQLSRR